MCIFKHADSDICSVRGIVGSAVDRMSEGSDSWLYLATSLHVSERLGACDSSKAEGSFYPQYLQMFYLHKNLQHALKSNNAQM